MRGLEIEGKPLEPEKRIFTRASKPKNTQTKSHSPQKRQALIFSSAHISFRRVWVLVLKQKVLSLAILRETERRLRCNPTKARKQAQNNDGTTNAISSTMNDTRDWKRIEQMTDEEIKESARQLDIALQELGKACRSMDKNSAVCLSRPPVVKS